MAAGVMVNVKQSLSRSDAARDLENPALHLDQLWFLCSRWSFGLSEDYDEVGVGSEKPDAKRDLQ